MPALNTVSSWLSDRVPALRWGRGYRRQDLPGDAIAGLVVAIMLVPQGMAYALLAGLPPQAGLYASILPLLLYALFGSSRVLAVGPVAIVSLMVAATAGDLATPGSAEYTAVALALAALSGLLLLLMGAARLGVLVNFMSHPVIAGFTSAAALIIGFSQLKHLLGVPIARSHHIHDIIADALSKTAQVNLTSLAIGAVSVAILWFCSGPLGRVLERRGFRALIRNVTTKAGPLFAVVLLTATVWGLGLDEKHGVQIIGRIPAGLPPLVVPDLGNGLWQELLGAAFLISVVGFLESVSVAKALASKRRQHIDANQELVGLGAANLGAAFSGGYPVTGGFSRSVVNFAAGANTPLASVITALLVALTVLLLTPLFYYLPKAVLASIIVVAVFKLLNWHALRDAWRYNKADAASLLFTFFAVLAAGIELGIVLGIGLSIGLLLWRSSRPHTAIVGRVGDSEHFRNVKRHTVRTCDHVTAIRVDESLYFANARFLEDTILDLVTDNEHLEHVVLICSAVNAIDTSALETLEKLREELADAGATLHLAEVKGPVEDRLKAVDFLEQLKPGRVFLSTDQAMRALKCV